MAASFFIQDPSSVCSTLITSSKPAPPQVSLLLLCPYPTFKKFFLAIALILPEMTLHVYLHTYLFVAIPLRCQIYKVKSIVKFIAIASVPRTWLQVARPNEYLLEIEGKNNMRGKYHFHNFIGEEAEAERYYYSSYHRLFFFPQKRYNNSFNQDHLQKNNAMSYFNNNL